MFLHRIRRLLDQTRVVRAHVLQRVVGSDKRGVRVDLDAGAALAEVVVEEAGNTARL